MRIFVTGATGYIGGAVAARLRDAGHQVRGLARDPAKGQALADIGIAPVLGTLDDAALLAAEAAAADAVVNAADSDHRGAVLALLSGLKGSGKPFLHTSGTSIVGDEAMGERADRIFDEETPFTPEPDKQARVAIDRLVLDSPDVRGTVLCNSMIYGPSLGLPTADSVQIPALVRQARHSGIVRHVGRGLNVWSNVHVADMADLYLLALEKAPAGTFLFVENGEAAYRDITAAIGTALNLGPAQDWAPDAAIAHWGREMAVFGLGSNSRVRARRARTLLGWDPRHTDVLAWIATGLRDSACTR